MISIDKAKQLKDLGLKWEPKNGDEYWHNDEPLVFCYECSSIEVAENSIWLPRLNQLLDEIKKYKYITSLVDTKFTLFKNLTIVVQFESDIREDAVADVLVYILTHHKC